MKKYVILLLLLQYFCWSEDILSCENRIISPQESFDVNQLLKNGIKGDFFQLKNIRGKGWEDRYKVVAKEDGSVFAVVYDGSAGNRTANYLYNNLDNYFYFYLQQKKCSVEEAFRQAFRQSEVELFKEYKNVKQKNALADFSGSTVVCAYIDSNKQCQLVHVGDSRGLGVNGTLIHGTSDHKPARESEANRIKKISTEQSYFDTIVEKEGKIVRVNGVSLARMIGGFDIKNLNTNNVIDHTLEGEGMITAEPEFTGPFDFSAGDYKIMLMSDGVTDVIDDNEKIAKYDSAEKLAMDASEHKTKGTDDITVIILRSVKNDETLEFLKKLISNSDENESSDTELNFRFKGLEYTKNLKGLEADAGIKQKIQKSEEQKNENHIISFITNPWFIGTVCLAAIIGAICSKFFLK